MYAPSVSWSHSMLAPPMPPHRPPLWCNGVAHITTFKKQKVVVPLLWSRARTQALVIPGTCAMCLMQPVMHVQAWALQIFIDCHYVKLSLKCLNGSGPPQPLREMSRDRRAAANRAASSGNTCSSCFFSARSKVLETWKVPWFSRELVSDTKQSTDFLSYCSHFFLFFSFCIFFR